jgi:hypothetical protein
LEVALNPTVTTSKRIDRRLGNGSQEQLTTLICRAPVERPAELVRRATGRAPVPQVRLVQHLRALIGIVSIAVTAVRREPTLAAAQ